MADNVISGYAARYNDETVIGGLFREKLAKGCFDQSLKTRDVVALLDHDTGRVLGRVSAGTLTLRSDSIGLWFSLDIDPTTPSGMEALGTVGRQDTKGCSFGFRVLAEEWDDGGERLPLRTLTEIELYEVTLTAFPAYESTSAAVRADNAAAARRRIVEQAERKMRLRGIQ